MVAVWATQIDSKHWMNVNKSVLPTNHCVSFFEIFLFFPQKMKILRMFFEIAIVAICEHPVEKGPCNGNFTRWYFNKSEDTCKPFRYGGCKGTKNNFDTEQTCRYQCKNPTDPKGN